MVAAIYAADLPTMGVILVMVLIFLIMGMFMDWVGIVLLIMPVFLPIVMRLLVEEIRLPRRARPRPCGDLVRRHLMHEQVGMGHLSPPFGPAAFYLKSVAPALISLTQIFAGVLPFICLQLLAMSMLVIWPPIVSVLL